MVLVSRTGPVTWQRQDAPSCPLWSTRSDKVAPFSNGETAQAPRGGSNPLPTADVHIVLAPDTSLRQESNPRLLFTRQTCCHYTTEAYFPYREMMLPVGGNFYKPLPLEESNLRHVYREMHARMPLHQTGISHGASHLRQPPILPFSASLPWWDRIGIARSGLFFGPHASVLNPCSSGCSPIPRAGFEPATFLHGVLYPLSYVTLIKRPSRIRTCDLLPMRMR